MIRLLIPAAILCLAAPVAGCALFGRGAIAASAPAPGPANEAEAALRRAEDHFKGRDFEDAERIFEHVRVTYPFLEASTIAELRLADIQFELEEWAAARDRYQSFAKLHPTHAEADYAAMRAAMTHYKEIPNEWFFFPPDHEKDQTAVNNALRALGDFIRQNPSSKHLEVVKAAYEDTRKRLVRHELHVAEFYARRKKWQAVVSRTRTALERFPGTDLSEQLYFTLHDAYVQLKDQASARQVLDEVQAKMPDTAAAARAKKLAGG